ncbi:phage tail tape measure protein [Pseudomonas sp. LS-2]|uniref:phage tail tape measure protein n=1 Tax=Pseudomonas sp. LS-2 TaxID=2315859 RepID=UPI000E74C7A8|nr:phage tail tape measure protein [Pseudomonas sp. LS-2]RJX81258.1 phage tail tape measure protein [Pseudomonas sp. LS-2]
MQSIELKVTADIDSATKNVGGFRKEYAEMVRAVEKPLRQVTSFRELEGVLEKTGRSITSAREAVRSFGDQLAATAVPSRQLQAEYRDSINQLKILERQEQSQTAQLARMRKELQSAGIDTRNLSAEQRRLQGDLSQKLGVGQRDKSIQDAQANLGIAKFSNTSAEIARLQADFQLLRSTGKLSSTEIAIAQNTLRQSIAAASAQTSQLTGATKQWSASLDDVKTQILAGAAAFGGFALAATRSFSTFASFQQQIAGINTITDLTQDQLHDLSDGIRALSRDTGKSASESAAAVYDLLGSGVATADALDVLALSTKAAVAGMSETKTAAGVGVSIVNAYGESISNLGLRYDQLFVAIQDGVVSFDQLAAGLGQVLPTAAAANVSFAEVAAAIARMTVQGIQAPIAITALRSAINQLASPAVEARKAMAGLGIEWKGLSATLQQVADKKLGFDALAQIIPDTEGRTAILALTKDYTSFVDEVKKVEGAAGATERAYSIMKATPQAQVEKFKAALEDLSNSFGQAVAAGLPLIGLLRDLLNAFNEVDERIKLGILSFVAFGVGAKAVGAAITAARLAFKVLSGSAAGASAQLGIAGAAMDGVSGKATRLSGILKSPLGGLVRGGAYGVLISQLAELYGLYQQMEELEQSQKDQKKATADLITKNQEYQETLIATPQALANMTQEERKSYAERLKAAQTYYRALSEQTARADSEKNGPTAPVSPEALEAFRRSREYGKAIDQINDAEQDRVAEADRNSKALTGIQDKLTTDTKAALAKQVQAQRAAVADIKKAQKEHLDTQKKYADALASLNSGSDSTDVSYGSAQALKVAAKKALDDGDIEGAKKQADQALKVIQKLADSGANTYGFAGFIKQLQAIEDEADKITLSKAEDSLKSATDKTAQLKADLDALSVVKIKPELSEEAVAQVKKQMRELQLSLGQPVDPLVATTALPQGTNLADSLVKKVTAGTQVPNADDIANPPVLPTQGRKLKYVPGTDSYSSETIGVDVAPKLPADAASTLQKQLDGQGDIPVDVEPEVPEIDSVDVPVETAVDDAALTETQSHIAAVADQFRRTLTIPVTVTGGGDAGLTVASNDLAGYADGDMVRGPGTGTSDSILARLSNGEFVMRAAAVRHYGPQLLRQINDRRLPKFAEGGAVGSRFVPDVSAPPPALLEQAAPASQEPFANVALTVGGETYNVQAPQLEFQRIVRNQRLKFGTS